MEPNRNSNVKEIEPKQKTTKEMKMKNKYPYQVLLLGDNTPECYDFEDEMRICEEDDSMDWWESKKPLEVIDAIKEMHNRYNEDSGWTWADDENAKEQQKPLKRLLAYANRQYKKHYANQQRKS